MARFLIDSVVLLIAAVLLVIVWSLLFGESASRGSDKIDPEPPARTPAGDWVGVWNGTRFTCTFHRDGSYWEDYGGKTYAGTWKYYSTSRVLEITEGQVPISGSTCLYSLHMGKCRRKMSGRGSAIRMTRRKK